MAPTLRRRFPSDFGPPLRRELVPTRSPTFLAELMGGLVLARIAHVLFDLARQNLGDADRSVGGSFWPCGLLGIADLLAVA
jgi:hypothetical protein